MNFLRTRECEDAATAVACFSMTLVLTCRHFRLFGCVAQLLLQSEKAYISERRPIQLPVRETAAVLMHVPNWLSET